MTKEDNLIWTKKYLPNNTSEIQGQDSAISSLKNFITNFKKMKKKAVILYGPTGCGKTSSVYSFAKEFDYEILEVNASDTRNAESIVQIIGNNSKQMSLFMKPKMILIDEIDGLSGNSDRGGILELIKIIETTNFPMILTCNDPYEDKLSSLRKKCEMIEFQRLNYLSVNKFLQKICEKEKIEYNEDDLKALSRRVGGDLRGAINDLQTLASFDKKLIKETVDELSGRKQMEDIPQALIKIFKTKDVSIARTAFENVDETPDKLIFWMDENLPKEYTQPEDLSNGFYYLSKADIFYKRIMRRQHWRFYVYMNDFMTAGIALSKKEKQKNFITYTPTKRILKLWIANQKNAKKKAICKKIAEKTHSSNKEVIQNTYPFIKEIFKKNKDIAIKIADEFDLDNEEIEYLKK